MPSLATIRSNLPRWAHLAVWSAGLHLSVVQPASGQQSVIIGVIRDSRGMPITEAEAALVKAKAKQQPNDRGWFVFDSLEAGTELLVVRAIGYRVQQLPLTLGPADTLELDVTLSASPQVLPEVTVNANGRELTGVAAEAATRMFRNGAPASGLITREDIETWGKFNLGSVLRRAGVRVVGEWATCPERGSGDVTVYLDGVLQPTNPNLDLSGRRRANAMDLRQFSPSQIEAIEVYRSVATRPVEFNATGGTGCLVLVWTRR